jgi:hypothetical protein
MKAYALTKFVDPAQYDFASALSSITLAVKVQCPICSTINKHMYTGSFCERTCARGCRYEIETFQEAISNQYPGCKIFNN